MIQDIVILTLSAFGAGLLVFVFPKVNSTSFKLTLVFAGAYLFSITIIHLLPELFTASQEPAKMGIYILVGFFMQILLAQLSSGVEHGHLHEPGAGHAHHHFSSTTLLVALCFHAFMEGTLLAHPADHVHQHSSEALLIGIIIHKMPAAFALMSVLRVQIPSIQKAVVLLLIFSIASPVGMLFSSQFHHLAVIDDQTFLIVYALVCGNFLHISTTIFFESSPEHRFHLKRLLVSLAGAFLAVLAEFFM